MHITDVIEDQDFKAIQAAEFIFQFKITPGPQEAVDQTIGGGEEHTAAEPDEFVAHGSQDRLRSIYGIDPNGIVEAVKELLTGRSITVRES